VNVRRRESAGLEARLASKVLDNVVDLLLRYRVDGMEGDNAIFLVEDLLATVKVG